jgi:hypothetical protein
LNLKRQWKKGTLKIAHRQILNESSKFLFRQNF